jgi:hypothetical protein
MFTCEILGVFFAMAAGRLPGRRAVRRQPTEKYTFDVSVNKRRRLGELTSAHWCAGDLWVVVSAERNATIVRFSFPGAMHLKYKPEEKGSFLRPFAIKVHGTWWFCMAPGGFGAGRQMWLGGSMPDFPYRLNWGEFGGCFECRHFRG